jgi:SAM-dependent methyltransferase
MNSAYDDKINAELKRYAEQEEVHDLPAIYDYWSERYCLPLITGLGFDGFYDFFDRHVAEQCARVAPRSARFVSLGAGNGDTEIGIALRLREKGINNLELILLELNPQMIDRALTEARQHDMQDRVVCLQTDLNEWHADGPADIYFASHSLHHVVELERVFDQVATSLHLDGVMLVNDMIGRNGHRRWPEAVDLVHRIWSICPERYRWNQFSEAPDRTYPDIDCSVSGFEGIRAQDILPLLLQRFHPDVYITFLNIADPFIDRVYGPNFDISRAEDLAFIDALGRFDDAAIDLGLVTPTHLIASLRMQPVPCRYPRERSPQRTLRPLNHDHVPVPAADASIKPQVQADTNQNATQKALVEKLERNLHESRARYAHLRNRKAVRMALTIAALRQWRPATGSRREAR